jgi:hypothetical protein
MNLSRRDAIRIVGGGSLALATFPLAGCSDQTTTAALLAELSTTLTAFFTDLGKVLPASITTAFTNAVAAVKAWVPGTSAQDVVQVLQDLSIAVSGFASVTPLTAVEAAALQLVLGTVVNIIELIDPGAVPAVATTAMAAIVMRVPLPAPPPQKHFKRGEISASTLKKQFEAEWLAATGKKAA